MCGRYVIDEGKAIYDLVGAENSKEYQKIRNYNAAPGQKLPILQVVDNHILVGEAIWGVIPFWAKDKSIGYKLINARKETIDQKPIWKQIIKNRIIIPASGFYEWKTAPGKLKIPYFITLDDHKPMYFAGLMSNWTDKTSNTTINSFTIITTNSTGKMADLHDRTPVILDAELACNWMLDIDIELDDILKTKRNIVYRQADIRVNSVKNNFKELINEQ